VGIEPESISRIENGLIAPTLVRLRQFALAYDCSLESLIAKASDSLPDMARRIATELDGLPRADQIHVAEQAVQTARYLQELRTEKKGPS
jgi:transcriptional regulator with XRE-family HTH domain